MPRQYIKHFVNDMDDSMFQRCIFCGEIVNDYRGLISAPGNGHPTGFGAGDLYISEGNPKVYTIQLAPGEKAKNCPGRRS